MVLPALPPSSRRSPTRRSRTCRWSSPTMRPRPRSATSCNGSTPAQANMVSRDSTSRPILLAILLLVSSALSAQTALEQVEKEVQRLFDVAKSSVVQIKAIRENAIPPLAAGTGFFVNNEGLILTSAQVVSDSNPNDIQVNWDGKKFD